MALFEVVHRHITTTCPRNPMTAEQERLEAERILLDYQRGRIYTQEAIDKLVALLKTVPTYTVPDWNC
jgi:hypothetical protein